MPKGSKDVYKTELKESSKGQEAPIKKGAALGQMVITPKDTNDPGFLTGKSLQVDLVTTSEVEEANWFTRAMRGIGSFFSGMWNSAVDTVKVGFKSSYREELFYSYFHTDFMKSSRQASDS